MSLINCIMMMIAPQPPGPGGTPLAIPYSFDALTTGQTSIHLTWTNDPLASGYEIQRKSGVGSFTSIATPSAGVTSYNDTGRTPNTMYYYRFKSIGTGFFSDSDWVNRNELTDDTTSAIAQVASLAMDAKGASSGTRAHVATFMESLAANECDRNIIAMYMLTIGADLPARLLNVVCPDDSTAAFRGTTIGSNAALDAKGVKNIAAGYFVDTNILPNNIVERPMIGFSFYLQTAVGQMINNGNAELNQIYFDPTTNPDRSIPNIGRNGTGPPWSGTNDPGHVLIQRDNWDQVRVWQNGVIKATDSLQHLDEITVNETPSNYFSANSPKLYTASTGTVVGLLTIFHSFETDAKVDAYNAAVEAFAIAENFNV
jgi:hypothetical protein